MVIHEVVPQLAGAAPQSFRPHVGGGPEQQPRRIQRGRAQEDDPGTVIAGLLGHRVEHPNAGGALLIAVVQHLGDDRERLEGQAARGHRGRQRGGLRAEVPPERAPQPTGVAVLTGGASRQWSREVRRAPGDDSTPAAELPLQPAGDHLLAAVEGHGRLELSVRELWHPLPRPRDARVAFDVIVPGSDVGVADRPVDRDPLSRVGLEVEVAPAIALAAPHERAPAHVIAAKPVEPLHLGVGRLPVRSPPVEVLLVQRVIPLQHRVGQLHRPGALAAMGVLPGSLGRVDIVLDVLDVLAPLEQQDAEPFLRQLFGGPAARDPRSHHDGVVALSLHGSSLAVGYCVDEATRFWRPWAVSARALAPARRVGA